jgi:dimethylamine/trimethylamine dehydrogenase
MRDKIYDVLFEPVRIGPLVAKNRFYQVPQCAGMGDQYINSQIKHREMKAEGGWAVVNTEVCESQYSSDQCYPCMHLWDDGDIRPMAKIAEAIHRHGALAGTEIGHLGSGATNMYTREAPIGASPGPTLPRYPVQVRAMDKQDIRDFLANQKSAARRAREAGIDIIYADASGVEGPPLSFISRNYNRRTDEYGGSIENRVRLLKEYILATREGAGPDRAVAVRICIDELMGGDGLTVEEDGAAVMELVGELPDLWDINVSDWENDSIVSRFGKEGSQEKYAAFMKQRTTKPVVGVGRFTSPDTMVSMIKRGVIDFIGAARPSIADPFLPKKIEEGRIDDIRECIGCNMCTTGFTLKVPSRCTQNPTIGEEWRRGWHPERVNARSSDDKVLIVGGGPAGLECAHILGKRGYEVALAEGSKSLGGRVTREAGLPGLSEWARVRDYRIHQFTKLSNVDVYLNSMLSADDILEFGAARVVIATGSSWRQDGFGRANNEAVAGSDQPHVIGPDEIFAGQALRPGPVLVFDDDHYYLANVIAEKLKRAGHSIVFVTPAPEPASFTHHTMEFRRTIKRLYETASEVVTAHNITKIDDGKVVLQHMNSGLTREVPCSNVVMVTLRDARDELYHALQSDPGKLQAAGIKSVDRIGDCLVPSTIAAAIWTGHRYARELDEPNLGGAPFLRERCQLLV